MKVLLFIIAAIAAYLITGWNSSITFAKVLYHDDIRKRGSGNPGFTNFRRVYGKKYSWVIFGLDIGKAAFCILLFGLLFRTMAGDVYDKTAMYQIGAAYTGVFCMLGNMYPLWYQFKGGKGYLVSLTVILCLNPLAAVIGFIVTVVLMLTLNYMSLATMCGNIVGVILLGVFHFGNGMQPIAMVLAVLCVVMMIIRHSQNIMRLIQGTESKSEFTLIDKVNALFGKNKG